VYVPRTRGPFVSDVNVAPTPEFAREVIDRPVTFTSVTIVDPLNANEIVILVDVGTDDTKYGVPAVTPFVVEPNTITLFILNPCAEPVSMIELLVIVVQVGVVPPLAYDESKLLFESATTDG
jgi:hypothetical protein